MINCHLIPLFMVEPAVSPMVATSDSELDDNCCEPVRRFIQNKMDAYTPENNQDFIFELLSDYHEDIHDISDEAIWPCERLTAIPQFEYLTQFVDCTAQVNEEEDFDPNWQNIMAGEPMSPIDLAFAILKKSWLNLGSDDEPSPPPAMQMDWIDHDIMDAHPDKVFLFGDNHARRGFGGQARHMRGHPQAVGIRTKHSPSMHPSAMWTDDTYDDNVRMIDEDIQEALSHNKQIVIPSAGIGTGLARLSENAPDTFAYLQEQLQGLMGNSD